MTLLAPALPGITFEAAPRPLDEALPRMDVCGFVGFASRGPIDVPVLVEDPVEFREVFGADPVVARTDDGVDVRANLGSAVEAFFASGGVRAWVVRVAKSGDAGAVTNRFAVPGVVVPGAATDVDGWRLLALGARSPGSWSDGLTVGATLSVTSTVAALDHDPRRVVVDRGVDVVSGDLLRLLLGDGRSLRVLVTGVAPYRDGRAVSFDPDAGWLIDGHPPLPPAGTAHRIGVGRTAALPSLAVDVGSLEPQVTVWVADSDLLAAGDLVAFAPPPGLDELTFLAIGDEQFDPADMTDESGPAGRRFEVTQTWLVAGGSVSWTDTSMPPGELVVEIERLRLTVRDGEVPTAELDGLGLGREHPRAVSSLPPDDLVYALLAGSRRRELVSDAPAAGPFDRALTPFEREATAPRFPLAAEGRAPLLLPLSVSTDPTDVAFGPSPAEMTVALTPVRNGLEQFSSDLFVDPALAGLGIDTILPVAWDVTSVRHGSRRLSGIHALVTNDDVTLVCVPDAVHTGWDRMTIAIPDPLLAPTLSVEAIDEDGGHVAWTSVPGATGYEIEHDADPKWSLSTRTGIDDAGRLSTVLAPREGCPHWEYARVRACRAGERGPWSNTMAVLVPAAAFARSRTRFSTWRRPRPSAPAAPPQVVWRSRHPSEAAPWEDLRAIQTATLRWCAARGDVLAVLTMPAAFTADDALRHVSVLRSAEMSPILSSGVRPLDRSEAAVLGYGALYHPWPVVGRADTADAAAGTRTIPPDGAIAGTYAARALGRGAWVAPARVPLDAALALTPAIDPARHLALVAAGVNPVADDPSGFMALTQATMSDEVAVCPVNVRRLIMLLRRLARRAGEGIVFEPNDRELQRLVRMRFERLLLGMFQRGAFAGAVPAEAFEISTGDNVNPSESVELGRFVVEVRFAPARPLEFITVRLVLAGVAGGEARP